MRDPHNVKYEQYKSLVDFSTKKLKVMEKFHLNDALILKSTQ